MHWKGLRILFDNDSKRQPDDKSRHGGKQFSGSSPDLITTEGSPENNRPPSRLPFLSFRHSESAPRLPPLTDPEEETRLSVPGNGTAENGQKPEASSSARPSTDWQSLRKNRFSFWRHRHASDPQLGTSYGKGEEDVPPVPPLPPRMSHGNHTDGSHDLPFFFFCFFVTAPTIITTSPNANNLTDPVKRENNDRRPISPVPIKQNSNSDIVDVQLRHAPHDSVGSSLAATRASAETPARLSTASRGAQRGSMTPDPRFSESSRSDQSLGNEAELAAREDSFLSRLMRFPRWKNGGGLSPKPRQGVAAAAAGGRKSVIVEDGTRKKPPTVKSIGSDCLEADQIPPLASPHRLSTTRPSSPAQVAQAHVHRHDSTNSAPSVRSFGSNANALSSNARERSSTVNSITDPSRDNDQHQIATANVTSARTSSSTGGRKSFGDLLGIGLPYRLRQNSEPPIPRTASPALGGGAASPTPNVESFSPPAPGENETADDYIARLRECAPRGVIAGVLAQSAQSFYAIALRKYMTDFSFFGDPIDMAIRKLLMEINLPKETQQIDRVLQGFADRYQECNPGIFASTDQAYFISFSILILHTDVFNKNNKRKMQKPDYVKNTRGESVSDDILEYIYDNVSYTPFIHIEDSSSANNGRYMLKPTRRPLFKTASTENLSRVAREPVDPYTIIMEGKLDTLKPSLKEVMKLEDTYSCTGPSGTAEMKSLHEAFAKSGVLQILSPRSRPDAFMSPSSIDNPADSQPGLVDIRVAKVGLLWRKDTKKKKTRSPWQEWGAILTFSQLYFFRDVNWIRSLLLQRDSQQKDGRRRTVLFRPFLTEFKPDAIMSTFDAVALLDSGYTKHKNAFVFLRHNSLEEVFLANNEADREDWLAKLNYAAAFRATGIRPRGMMATNYELQKYRVLPSTGPVLLDDPASSVCEEPMSPNVDAVISGDLPVGSRCIMLEKVREANEKLFDCQRELDHLLRNAMHLQILTPLQSRTRESIIMAAGRMTAKVKWVRQNIWRIRCYRSMLLQDIGGQQTWNPLSMDTPADMLDGAESISTIEPTTIPAGLELHESQSFETAPSFHMNTPPDEGFLSDDPAPRAESTLPLTPAVPDDARRPSVPTSSVSSEFSRAGGRKEFKERVDSTAADSKLEREPSAFSGGSRMSSFLSTASRMPSNGSVDDNEEPPPTATRSQFDDETTAPQQNTYELSQQIQPKRRSLQRTLRNAHPSSSSSPGSIQNRIKKRRSSSTQQQQPVDGEQPEEEHDESGLPRKAPSFIVHGKKASIVTFGSEWQNDVAPEERLKLRKPTPSDGGPRSSEHSLVGSSVSPEGGPRRASAASRWSFHHNNMEKEEEGVVVSRVNSQEQQQQQDGNNGNGVPTSPGQQQAVMA